MGLEAQPNNPVINTPASPQAPAGASAPVSTPSAPSAPAIAPELPRTGEAPRAPAVASPQSLERTPTRKLLDGDGSDLPEDAEIYEISRSNFKKRLQRATTAQLKNAFGTDNIEEVLAWKTQNEEFKKREEEAKLAQMTEADRYKTLHEKSEQQASYWKTQYEQLQEQYQTREQDRQVMGIVARHVKSKCLDYVSQELAKHLQTLEEDDMRDPQAYIDQWTSAFVKENPEFGVQQAAPAATPPAPQGNVQQIQVPGQPQAHANGTNGAPRQVPFTNGPQAGRPQNAVPAGSLSNKTAAPGLPNSMTDDEWKRYKRDHGFNF